MPGSSADSHDDESFVFTNGLELRPQLLYTKFQRLKNTPRPATVVVINEHPTPRMMGTIKDTTTRATTNMNETKSNLPDSNNETLLKPESV